MRSIYFLLNVALLIARGNCQSTQGYAECTQFKEPYVCAMFVENTLDLLDLSKSSFVEFWNIHSYSPAEKLHRHDEIFQSQISLEGSLSKGGATTLFLHSDGVVKQIVGRKTMSKTMAEEADNKNAFASFTIQSYFEPMCVPVIGRICFEQQRGPGRLGIIERVFLKYKLVDEEETPTGTFKTFHVRPDIPVFDKILFEGGVGNMPVSVHRTSGQNGRISEIIRTKWEKYNEKWLPTATEIEVPLAGLNASWRVKYYWLLDDIPKEVFEIGKLHASKLKEHVISKLAASVK
jgi:hypothetical protein